MNGLTNLEKGKKWTDSERIELFKMVKAYGRKWKEICEKFGVSPKACANKYRNTNWKEVFKRNNTNEYEVTKAAWDDYSDGIAIADAVESQEIVDKAKLKLIESSNKRIQNDLAKRAAVTDLIIEKIEGSLAKVPQITTEDFKYTKTAIKRTEEEACLVMSDFHIGLACLPEEVGGLGNYNTDIFLNRLENLVNTIEKITNIHRSSYKVDTLNIFGIGDFVHGSNDAGQWGMLHTEQNIMDQVFMAVHEISKAIAKMHTFFPKINFYGIYGNHGRTAKRNVEKPFVNWDYLVYHMIQSRFTDNPNINFIIPRAPFCIADVQGHKFLLIHGDQVKMWNGIPFYGLLRAEGKYRNMLSRKNVEKIRKMINEEGGKEEEKDQKEFLKTVLDYSNPFDFMIMGHFHQPAEIDSNGGGKIIMNNSFVGGDDYTINDLLLSGTASQKFFGMHPEGKTWTYDIDLDRK